MQLPNCSAHQIADRKITHYLLDPNSKDGRSKCSYFAGQGFSLAEWQLLRDAIMQHPMDHLVTGEPRRDKWGRRYEVRCSLRTPNGKNRCIRTIWQIDADDPRPKFITAYPADT
ncbi:DUF6883 domain-containing protein [Roseomonas sp. BN140053]|uniref:DUF6883 domain-containing protein n=1 Tax=Roseomonas sp. BN140053 TaxID=3391898 RepID=UPI0039ECE4BC